MSVVSKSVKSWGALASVTANAAGSSTVWVVDHATHIHVGFETVAVLIKVHTA